MLYDVLYNATGGARISNGESAASAHGTGTHTLTSKRPEMKKETPEPRWKEEEEEVKLNETNKYEMNMDMLSLGGHHKLSRYDGTTQNTCHQCRRFFFFFALSLSLPSSLWHTQLRTRDTQLVPGRAISSHFCVRLSRLAGTPLNDSPARSPDSNFVCIFCV